MEEFDEDDIQLIKGWCEDWGRNWQKDFPHRNITPKGHDLVFVIPEFIKRSRSFYRYYKIEQKGESIHAELNDIERKIWSIRNEEERHWQYIERYELRNVMDVNIVTPLKKYINKQ